ncbi:OppA family ABC transporter substrate-binding lipoprotein [Mycoplasmopsis lipofaciens]|uniref:OppA family ABC transporter substrate-binding lipoprotein n=1 Tax=Mycoplasmopsis lipofaciens TaxID=114884 RepID=UPI00068CD953|nr:hypothetical protein [Mycoplasmopsis lipofaciens]
MKFKKIFKILSLPTFFSLPTVALSCINIRNSRNHHDYVKRFNYPNTIKDNFNINKVKRIETDFESLLTSPLLRWKYTGKAQYDSVNNVFFKPTFKYLEFYLAKSIKITFKDPTREEVVYTNDIISFDRTKNYDSKSGILQIYNNEDKLNINNEEFFANLKSAKKITFFLKDDIYYSDYLGNPTQYLLKPIDYYRAIMLNESNQNDIVNLYNNYNLDIDKLNPYEFQDRLSFSLTSSAENEKNDYLSLFVLQELTNNLIFNPISDEFYQSKLKEYGTKLENTLFISQYILNKNSLDEQIFIKNYYSANQQFNDDDSKIETINLKYNPIKIDEPTYRLQMINGFKQNLISEASLNIFNNYQQNEINNYSKIYGLTYVLDKPSNENVNTYFYNLIPQIKNGSKLLFNNAFSKLFYSYSLNDILNKNYKLDRYYTYQSIELRSIFNQIINPYKLTQLLKHNQYWNSFASQSLTFDSSNKENINFNKSIDLIQNINRIYDIHYSYDEDVFKTNIIDFKGQNGLISNNLKKNNIINIDKQLLPSNYLELKNRLKKLLDDFYVNNPEINNQLIEWTIPIYSPKSTLLEDAYKRIIKIFHNIDNRLNPSFEFLNKNSLNSFSTNYQFYSVDNSFSNHILKLIDNSNNSLITSLASFELNINNLKNKKLMFFDSVNYLLNTLLKELKISKTSFYELINKKEFIFNKDKLNFLLNTNDVDKTEFQKNIKKTLQSLTTTQQLKLLVDVDNFLGIRANETTYLFTNDYSKDIVQYFYEKPLNELGITYFQDIDVII